MPFTQSAGSYQGGAYIASGLEHFGDAIGGAIQRYQQMATAQQSADSMMDLMTQLQVPDPADPDGKKMMPLIPKKAAEAYRLNSGSRKVAAAAGMKGAMEMWMDMVKMADEHRERTATTKLREKELTEVDQPTKIDPLEGRPGWGIVRKTGALIPITNEAASQEAPEIDPSGKFYKVFEKGEWRWKPIPAATMMLPGMGMNDGTGPGGSTFNVRGGDKKQLDADTARKFLKQANGDKEKARSMARAAGYTF